MHRWPSFLPHHLFVLSICLSVGCNFGSNDEDLDEDSWGGTGASGDPSAGESASASDEGSDSGSDGASGCATIEAALVGRWITPPGSTESSDSYNLLEFEDGGTGKVDLYAGGYSMNQPFSWRLEEECTQIHYDYGSGWLSDYSVIHQLDETTLDIEATDGTYLGTRTVYDRLGGGASGDTCQAECTDSTDCDAGQACLDSEVGSICLPPECETCWEQGVDCLSNATDCTFDGCGDPDPDASDTCGNPCSSEIDCNAGEACLNSEVGSICLPPDCQDCWDDGLDCNSSASTCAFNGCD